MLELIFGIMMLVVFGKLFIFGMKATWGITKFLVMLVFLPLGLIAMVLGGLFTLALPILIVIGLVSLVCCD